MTPRQLIATATVPGGEPLRLFRRGDDFMIVLDRNELMSSRMSGSEEALAVMTCERLRDRHWELGRRYNSALQGERHAIDAEQRRIDAQLAAECPS